MGTLFYQKTPPQNRPVCLTAPVHLKHDEDVVQPFNNGGDPVDNTGTPTHNAKREGRSRNKCETSDVARGCCLEMIMKSTETFNRDPGRVMKWTELAVRLAKEVVA